jgi:plasmid stabilization system protein ParE
MQRRLRYLQSAKSDLVDIFSYLARESGSLTMGRQFVERLREQCRKLAHLPGTLGRARPELRADVRSFPFRGYVIFFRYTEDALEIINILEGHRDIGAHFGEE